MANTHDHDTPPAMDYAQHEATYRGFTTLVKLGIVNMALVMLALYAFIEGHSPILGVVLLILSVVVPAGMLLTGRRR